MNDELLTGGVLLMAGSVVSGVAWTIHKVIQHDAWLEHIKDSLVRVEGKLDRLIEKHL